MKISENIDNLSVEKYGLNDEIVTNSSYACIKCGEQFEPTTTICPKCKNETIYSKYNSLKSEIKNYNRKMHRMVIVGLTLFILFGVYYVLAENGCLKSIGISKANTVILLIPVWIIFAVEALIIGAYKKTLYSAERRIVSLVNDIKDSINEYIKQQQTKQ